MVEHRAHDDASVTLRATDQFHSIDPLTEYPDRHYRVKLQKLVIQHDLFRLVKDIRAIAFPTQIEPVT